MFDPTRMRFFAQNSRERHADDPQKRDEALAGLIAESMVSLRNEGGAVTHAQLSECGFTAEELTRLGSRAKDSAARTWHAGNMMEAAA